MSDMTPAMRSAMVAAVRRGGVVMTNTRTHRAMEARGWVEGVQITAAGRQAVSTA